MAAKFKDYWDGFVKLAAVITCLGTLSGGVMFAFDSAQSWQRRFDNIDAGLAQINRALDATNRSQTIDEQVIENLKTRAGQQDTAIATSSESLRHIDEATRSMSGQLAELYSYLLRNRHAGADRADHQTASSDH